MSRPPHDLVARLREAADAPDLAGTRYAVGERIGRGGMGTVYRAWDAELERDVALKVLGIGGGGLDERALREARTLAQLEHPGIVPVHDAGRLPDGRLFTVMKLVRGERLDAWARGGRSAREVARLFRRVCDAVAFAHARGVLHRDLKPSNIMVGEFGEAIVLDWGLARRRGPGSDHAGAPHTRVPAEGGGSTTLGGAATTPSPETADGVVLGTEGFMAPEQARGELAELDQRADVFALGATLAAILPTPAPRALLAVCERARAADRAARYPEVRALAADLDAWLDGLPPSAYREPWHERTGRLLRRHGVLVALVLAYLVMRLFVLLVLKV